MVGMYQSGKSVFITSLINHLQRHDSDFFRLGNGDVQLHFVKDKLELSNGFQRFKYLHHRQRLGNREWPDKTLVAAEYSCRLKASHSKTTANVELSLIDFPGERLADLSTMAGHKYAEWCDQIWDYFDMPEYREYLKEYRGVSQQTDAAPDAIVLAYRRLLGILIHHYLPMVTPSTFLVDAAGRYVETRDIEEMARCQVTGLDKSRQFAPLPAEVRASRPDVVKVFAEHFDAYRRQEVLPLVEGFRQCDALAVLIDVTMLLAGGPGMYNSTREMLRTLLDCLDLGQGTLTHLTNRAVRFFTMGRVRANDVVRSATFGWWGPNNIRRLAFVATKADKVHARDLEHLHSLLKDLTSDLAAIRFERNLEVKDFACAAVNSTVSEEEYPWLQGRLLENSPDGGDCRFRPSALPECWPKDWRVGDFKFPNVQPWMPPRHDAPPEQIELDRVCSFLLEF